MTADPVTAHTHSPACDCTWIQTTAGWVRVRLGKRCSWHRGTVLDYIALALAAIDRKVDHMTSQQDELNADVAQLTTIATGIASAEQDNTTALSAVQAELDSLKNANPSLDLSALEAAINGSPDGTVPGLAQAAAAVTANSQALAGLVPAPAPAPDSGSGS